MPQKKNRVYTEHDGTYRYIVAAPNLRAAAPLLNTTVGGIRRYGGRVRDTQQVALAMQEPGVVWRRSMLGAKPDTNPWERWG